ncbi:hypothetical protein AMTR_s00053p00209900 [Amborella trichopoda]|uniref:Uncharacterized protein n=1 Tax=Amborella trichopoda TaxID=13333 RepID=W1PB66_AMBTC|nr:hypothetical protein AMTR_s00053p00209900 [Amborella trichopoda]
MPIPYICQFASPKIGQALARFIIWVGQGQAPAPVIHLTSTPARPSSGEVQPGHWQPHEWQQLTEDVRR